MGDIALSMGIDSNGKPFPVHATVAPEYGAGALGGLVVGLTLGADGAFRQGTPPLVAQMVALVESLMARGMFDASDVADRYRAWPACTLAEAPLRALPIALFFAGLPDELSAAVLSEVRLTEGQTGEVDWRSRLAAVAVSAAVAAGAFELVNSHDMGVAAVLQLDETASTSATTAGEEVAASKADIVEAHRSVRDDLRRAVAATHPDDLGEGAPDVLSNALRHAFWHLVHDTDFEPAMRAVSARGEPLAAALTGLLLGAAQGVEAIPPDWQAAIETRVSPLLVLLPAD